MVNACEFNNLVPSALRCDFVSMSGVSCQMCVCKVLAVSHFEIPNQALLSVLLSNILSERLHSYDVAMLEEALKGVLKKIF